MQHLSSGLSTARTPRRVSLRQTLTAAAIALFSAAVIAPAAHAGTTGVPTLISPAPQTTWAPVGTAPESDELAAAQVVRTPENRPGNTYFNDYFPSQAELNSFYSTKGANGLTPVQDNPLYADVNGRSDLWHPSTDDLIQWAAHKWGIPQDWISALAVYESWWRQDAHGDLRVVPAHWYSAYPANLQEPYGRVYEEAGITQMMWLPNETVNPGTAHLRWRSTAFALDYMGATIRYYYDGDCHSCGAGYGPGQQWASVGAWHAPEPWNNADAQSYEASLQRILAARTWTTPGFQRPCAISLSVGACEAAPLG